MLGYIVDFITAISNMISGILHLFKSAFDGLISLFQMLPSLISDMSMAVGLLPTVLVTFFSVSLTVTIIFLVLGRGKGGE